jgi:hypothetical protein
VGDVGITAIPFETFAETGLALKAESPFQPTFNIELANGSYGYLPTPPQHELGGYETWLGTNLVETEASEKIRNTLIQLFVQLREWMGHSGIGGDRSGPLTTPGRTILSYASESIDVS